MHREVEALRRTSGGRRDCRRGRARLERSRPAARAPPGGDERHTERSNERHQRKELGNPCACDPAESSRERRTRNEEEETNSEHRLDEHGNHLDGMLAWRGEDRDEKHHRYQGQILEEENTSRGVPLRCVQLSLVGE